jgi:biotin synthase-related radical SAM superfamily protein
MQGLNCCNDPFVNLNELPGNEECNIDQAVSGKKMKAAIKCYENPSSEKALKGISRF